MTFEQFIEALRAKLIEIISDSVEVNHNVEGEIEVSVNSTWSCILKIEDVVKAKLYQVKDWDECINKIASSIKKEHDASRSRRKPLSLRFEMNWE